MKSPRQHCLCLALTLAAATATAADQPPYVITFHVQASTDGQVAALVVDEAIPVAATPAGAPLLTMPFVTSNVPTIAASVDTLDAHDDHGPLQLRARDQGEGPARQRQWYANRAVAGTLRFSYHAAMTEALAARGAAPPIELRSEEAAFSGAGATFLLHPPAGRYDIWVGTPTLDRWIKWRRHGDTSNVLYLDGHARSITKPDAYLGMFPGGQILRTPTFYPQ